LTRPGWIIWQFTRDFRTLVCKLNLSSLFYFIFTAFRYGINKTEFVELAMGALGKRPLWVLPEIHCNWYKVEFNNFLTSCDLFSLLHFCRQLYMFRVLTPIITSSYNCNYSFWYWLTIRSCYWVGNDSCVSYCRYSYLPYDIQRMVVDPVNQYQKP